MREKSGLIFITNFNLFHITLTFSNLLTEIIEGNFFAKPKVYYQNKKLKTSHFETKLLSKSHRKSLDHKRTRITVHETHSWKGKPRSYPVGNSGSARNLHYFHGAHEN